MTVFDWLKQPTTNGVPVLSRLAELVMVNGGTLQISEWGKVEPGGLYGRIGLTADEALELIYLDGFLQGMLTANDGRDAEQVRAAIDQEIEQRERQESP